MRNYKAMSRYVEVRAQRPDLRAKDIWAWVNCDDPGTAQSIDQFICSHDWAINEESDRCYCLNCGADGDS